MPIVYIPESETVLLGEERDEFLNIKPKIQAFNLELEHEVNFDKLEPQQIVEHLQITIDQLLKDYKFLNYSVRTLQKDQIKFNESYQRQKKEHVHIEAETHLVIGGKGYFFINRYEDEGPFCIICEKGDVIHIPTRVKHWLLLDDNLYFKTIELYTDPVAWIPHFTHSDIEDDYLLGDFKTHKVDNNFYKNLV